jgi:hypothetical protein
MVFATMTEHANYNELDERGIWCECVQRGVSTTGVQGIKDLIARLIEDDKSKRRPDINQYTNRNDPSGEKRWAQAAEKRDWEVHNAGNIQGAVIKVLKVQAGNARAGADSAEAQASEAESVLRQKLLEIMNEFRAKEKSIQRDLAPKPEVCCP